MPYLQSTSFGEIEYPLSAAIRFPVGLPGFDDERGFVFLERPGTAPLMFLHSISNPDLCFILLPILVVQPQYDLSLAEEDRGVLEFPPDQEPQIGRNLLCGALVSMGSEGAPPTINLLAPVVVNLEKGIGCQVIQTQSGYSHCHPLFAEEELLQCS